MRNSILSNVISLAFTAALSGLVLAACGGGASGPRLEQAEDNTRMGEYNLGAGDRLGIVVFGQSDLSGEFEIDGAGKVSMPLIGQVEARGMSTTQLQEKITTSLSEKYIVDPSVSVEVVNYRPFYILGEVQKPGRFDYVSGIDVRQAVALAGGFTRRGRQDVMKLIREGDQGRMEYEAGPDNLVLPGDTIEVLRRLF